jgi:hypothetical protein
MADPWMSFVTNGLKAKELLQRDRDYIVRGEAHDRREVKHAETSGTSECIDRRGEAERSGPVTKTLEREGIRTWER